MANNFSDAINYYLFESGAELTDGAGSSNLTEYNTPGYETGTPIEGAKSPNLDNASAECFYVSDSNLPTTNPLKSTSSEDELSISVLIYPHLDTALVRGIICKYDSTSNKRTLRVTQNGTKCEIYIGYTGGVNTELLRAGSNGEIPKNKKLHIGFTYKYSTKAWTLRIYNVTDSSELLNTSGNTTNTMSVDDSPLCIGSYFLSGTPATASWDGQIDEVVIWDAIKTSTDWDAIIGGTYGSTGVASTVIPILLNLYRQRRA